MNKTEEFIKKAKLVHNDFYDYSKIEYINNHTKVLIVCPIHGEFWQQPNNHLQSKGCKTCGLTKHSTLTNNERKLKFIENAFKVHKDENLDYSKVDFKNNRTKVCIIDHNLKKDGTEYGEFWQTPSNHLKGQLHPLKKIDKFKEKMAFTQEDVIEKFKEKHKHENIDYSEVEYVDMFTKVKLIDRDLKDDGTEFGVFWQTPQVHIRGCGHPEKNNLIRIKKATSNTNDFVKKANVIHENKFTYQNTCYINNRIKVVITCPIHGDFEMTPSNHLKGQGCPKCGTRLSYAEEELLKTLKNNGIECFQNDHKILNGLELDIFIPSHNLAIEYNGLRWHSDKFGKDKNYHLNKTIECEKQGIQLIHIFEDEWLTNKEIVLNKLKTILKLTEKIKEKSEIKEIDSNTCEMFHNEHSLTPYVPSEINLGAFVGNKLVATISFNSEHGKSRKWLVNAFSVDDNYDEIKLKEIFNFFTDNNSPQEIMLILDRRWNTNIKKNIFTDIGFTFEKYVKQDFKWYYPKKGLLRFNKNEIIDNEEKHKIWDCGKIKYKLKPPNN